MSDQDIIARFFERVVGPHPEVPATISGRLRFDVEGGPRREHWKVTFGGGSVSVERSDGHAECVARTDAATLAAIIEGRQNAMAALLRGSVMVEGDTLLMAVFRSLLTATEPAPAGERSGAWTGRRR